MIQLVDKAKIRKEASDALLRLGHNPDFQAYQDYLRMYLLETREKGDTMISPNKEWNQGWCQALTYILDLPDTIKNMHSSKS